MKDRIFFFSDLMHSFFIITSCVCIAMGVIGSIFFPDLKFGYEAFFSPVIFGIVTVLTSVVFYSKKELGVKQMLIRQVLQFFLVEVLVLFIHYFEGTLVNWKVTLSLIAAVGIIFFITGILSFLRERALANKINSKIQSRKRKHSQVS